jgi:serine/threonine-protein kinase BUR1
MMVAVHCLYFSSPTGSRSSRTRASIYMVFPYMDHDLSGLLNNPKVRLSVPQIKLYMKQLLEGTIYMHSVSVFLATLIDW